mmetsp:Transcript_64961/g.174397  ORF Transcript_64961/g.174397 Transcript_64961/m.174397 type:complete len:202 (-) Transcript_64961:40-645(-)
MTRLQCGQSVMARHWPHCDQSFARSGPHGLGSPSSRHHLPPRRRNLVDCLCWPGSAVLAGFAGRVRWPGSAVGGWNRCASIQAISGGLSWLCCLKASRRGQSPVDEQCLLAVASAVRPHAPKEPTQGCPRLLVRWNGKGFFQLSGLQIQRMRALVRMRRVHGPPHNGMPRLAPFPSNSHLYLHSQPLGFLDFHRPGRTRPS